VDALLSAHGVARVRLIRPVPAATSRAVTARGATGAGTGSRRSIAAPTANRRWPTGQLLAEAAAQRRAWFVLDNTALGHATGNALHLQALLQENEHA
jgi:hypothetical protein